MVGHTTRVYVDDWQVEYGQANHIVVGEEEEARAILNWAQERTQPSGVLSEQFDPETGTPLGVAPLVWSHAEFINTALDIVKIK